jgi:hypothetical protein
MSPLWEYKFFFGVVEVVRILVTPLTEMFLLGSTEKGDNIVSVSLTLPL